MNAPEIVAIGREDAGSPDAVAAQVDTALVLVRKALGLRPLEAITSGRAWSLVNSIGESAAQILWHCGDGAGQWLRMEELPLHREPSGPVREAVPESVEDMLQAAEALLLDLLSLPEALRTLQVPACRVRVLRIARELVALTEALPRLEQEEEDEAALT